MSPPRLYHPAHCLAHSICQGMSEPHRSKLIWAFYKYTQELSVFTEIYWREPDCCHKNTYNLHHTTRKDPAFPQIIPENQTVDLKNLAQLLLICLFSR